MCNTDWHNYQNLEHYFAIQIKYSGKFLIYLNYNRYLNLVVQNVLTNSNIIFGKEFC